MTLAHAILAARPVERTSGAEAVFGPAASCAARYRQQHSVRGAHSALMTLVISLMTGWSLVLALIGRHRRKSERVTITPIKHQRSSSCE